MSIDNYPKSDFSGFTCGVILDEKMEHLANNPSRSCGNYDFNWTIGGSGAAYGNEMRWVESGQ